MPKLFLDPFFPDRPADSPDLFAGRLDEVNELLQYLFNTANQRPKHILITGDRGIGKSSMLRQTQRIAQGQQELIEKLRSELGPESVVEAPDFSFVTVWHSADSGQDAEAFAGTLINAAKSEMESFFSNFTIEWNWLVTVKRDTPNVNSATDLAKQFCKTVKKAADKLVAEKRSGIIFCIDEADTFPPNSGVAIFLKNVIDSLHPMGIKNVAFVLAGISGALQCLMHEHPSVSRSFHEVHMPPLSFDEGSALLRNGFQSVNVSFDQAVIAEAFAISAGCPEPLHLLGSALLSVDTDGHLAKDDLLAAKRKILNSTRHSVLESRLVHAGSGINQRILQAMATSGDTVATSEQIRSQLPINDDDFSSALQALIERNVIKKEAKGAYRFVEPLLREYVIEYGVIDIREPSTGGGTRHATQPSE